MFARHGSHLTSRRPDVCWHSKPQHRFSSCRQSRCNSLPVQSRIRARWCIDIKYGVKLDAVALLSEWVQNIGSQAGLSDNVHILSGAVGVPESRIELEVEFSTLSELEQFWANIPPQDHKAWSQRAQHLIIDGSPKWDIYRTVSVSTSGSSSTAAITPRAVKTEPEAAPAQRPHQRPARRDPLLDAATAGGVLLDSGSFSFKAMEGEAKAEQNAVGGGDEEVRDGRKMVLDWKGDPMYINPGDKMPF